MSPGSLLRIQPGEMQVKRAFPDPKDVGPLTADNLANELAAVTGTADDLLDGDALLGQGENDAVGLLPAQIALVLDLLRCSEQSGINSCRSDDYADLAHRLAHGIQEGVAGVLHQVPTVSDLDGVR